MGGGEIIGLRALKLVQDLPAVDEEAAGRVVSREGEEPESQPIPQAGEPAQIAIGEDSK